MIWKYTANPLLVVMMLCFPIFVGLKKWVEVGNSGVFRPEMLLPMGLPENVSVIAWGLSLERLLMCHGRTCYYISVNLDRAIVIAGMRQL